MQSRWKTCPHAGLATRSAHATPDRQMTHSGSAMASFTAHLAGEKIGEGAAS